MDDSFYDVSVDSFGDVWIRANAVHFMLKTLEREGGLVTKDSVLAFEEMVEKAATVIIKPE